MNLSDWQQPIRPLQMMYTDPDNAGWLDVLFIRPVEDGFMVMTHYATRWHSGSILLRYKPDEQ